MSVLGIKLRRDIVRSLGMLLAVVAITAVGVGSLVGMLGTFNNLTQARGHYYAQCRMADFWVDLKKAPMGALQSVQAVPGISELRTRIAFPTIVDLEGVEQPINGLVLSMPEKQEPVINTLIMRQGSYFSGTRRDEVIVSEKFAKARNIHAGTFLHLILNGQKKKLFVVGTAISSEFIYFTPPGGYVDDPMQSGVFFIRRDYAEDVFGFHGAFNSLVGILAPEARANPQPVLHELSRRLDNYGVFTTTPLKLQFSHLTLNSEMSGVQTMATMFPLMFLAVAALVMNVLMTRMTEQQRTVIGTLKALGYSNSPVFYHFLQFGLFVGIFGGIGGWVLGYWIAGGMTMIYNQVFTFPSLVNQVYPGVMLIGLVIAVVFAVLGTLRGVRLVAGLNPAEAMREPAPPSCGMIVVERWQGFWHALDFRWQMILRGLFRNKGRTIISMLAAAMGASLVVLAFGLVNSMDAMISFQFDKVLLSDYIITLKDELDGSVVQEIENLPSVVYAEPVFNVACTFQSRNHRKKGVVTGLIPNARLTVPHQADGTVVRVPPVGLLMTQRLAKQIGVQKGDLIELTPVKGLRHTYTVPVVDTITSMIGLGVYANYHYLNTLVGEVDAVSEVQARAYQTPQQRAAFFKEMKRRPKLETLGDMAVQKAALTKQFDQAMKGMAVVMILLAGVIFFGSILNGSLISIAERRREIATFRVLGYQPSEVGIIFLRENLVVNMIGAVLGLPFGFFLLQSMMTQFQNDAYAMPTTVAPSTWLYTLALALLFVLGSHCIVQRSINTMPWNEALSMKE